MQRGGRGRVLHTVGDQAVETLGEPGGPLFLGTRALQHHCSESRLCRGPTHVTLSDLLRSQKPLSEDVSCFLETSKAPPEMSLMGISINRPMVVPPGSPWTLSDRQLTAWSSD